MTKLVIACQRQDRKGGEGGTEKRERVGGGASLISLSVSLDLLLPIFLPPSPLSFSHSLWDKVFPYLTSPPFACECTLHLSIEISNFFIFIRK